MSRLMVIWNCHSFDLVTLLSKEQLSQTSPGRSVCLALVTALARITVAAVVWLFADFENSLWSWQLDCQIRVVDLVAVKLFHLSLRYEASLVSESSFGQILAAVVPDLLLSDTFSLLEPVPHNLFVDDFFRI